MRKFAALILLAIALFGCASESKNTNIAPDFAVMPLDDQAKTTRLSDFKGKVVLLDFWATWCGPCRESMPELQAVHEKYKGRVEVMSISAEPRPLVFSFHQSSKLTYPVYLDVTNEANMKYQVTNLPTFFIIKDGKVLFTSEGYVQGMLMAEVEKALGS